MAEACDACVVGFNVRNPTADIALAATQAKIKVSDPIVMLSDSF